MTSGDNRPCATHQWQEVPEEAGQYVCIACCATGYRSKFGGVAAHKQQRTDYYRKWTAMDKTKGRGGRVKPKPGAP